MKPFKVRFKSWWKNLLPKYRRYNRQYEELMNHPKILAKIEEKTRDLILTGVYEISEKDIRDITI